MVLTPTYPVIQDKPPFTLLVGKKSLLDMISINFTFLNGRMQNFVPLIYLYNYFFLFNNRNGNISIMHKMLKHGADLRVVDQQGKTSLHHAVSGGSM